MNQFEKTLITFESLLKKINAPILELLQTGLVDWKEDYELVDFPDEVKILYKWRNGTNIKEEFRLDHLWLFNFGVFLPLNTAIETYTASVNKVEKWDENKFPLFASGGGELYLLECNKKSREYGMLYYHSIGDIEIDIAITKYDSLETFIQTIHRCYSEGAYRFSETGEILFDVDIENKIGKELNPRSEYWYSLFI